MFPRARRDNLTVRELPDETLVYDQQRHKAHCLNRTAALVWRHCDGNTSIDELARIVAGEMGIDQANAVVALALEQLGRRHLLDEAPPLSLDRVSRRDALKKLALAVASLPLVMTVATKAAAQTISDPPAESSASSDSSLVIQPVINIVQQQAPRQAPQAPQGPCRTKGQSCLAAASGQQGTCCPGLKCGNVFQGAGVCA
jgi:hypothetical protein